MGCCREQLPSNVFNVIPNEAINPCTQRMNFECRKQEQQTEIPRKLGMVTPRSRLKLSLTNPHKNLHLQLVATLRNLPLSVVEDLLAEPEQLRRDLKQLVVAKPSQGLLQ